MRIQVLGTGCPKCARLVEMVEKALAGTGCGCVVEKVTSLEEIVSMGVMVTPALAIDGRIVVSGRLPREGELLDLLKGCCGN